MGDTISLLLKVRDLVANYSEAGLITVILYLTSLCKLQKLEKLLSPDM